MNVLSSKDLEQLIRQYGINNFNGGVLVVTHNIDFIKKTNCDIHILDKNLTKYKGSCDDYEDEHL